MKRLAYAIAALAAVAVTAVIDMTPAAAAPGDGLCSIAEWRNPLKYADCAGRLVAGAQAVVSCTDPPEPVSPASGAADSVTVRPDNPTTGRYGTYGVAGYNLHLYDTGCAGQILHPSATAQTAAADMLFGSATTIVGVANTLRTYAYDPTRMWGWADPALDGLTKAVFDQTWSVWGALSIALLGCWLIWRAKQGHLSQAFKAVTWAVAVVVVVTAVASWPSTSVHYADKAAATGLSVVQAPFTATTGDSPSDTLVDAVLYRQWLQAVLGSADSPTAQKYGPALHDASTLTWAEANDIEQDPSKRAGIIAAKNAQWKAVAAQVKAEDPEAYTHLQGMRGSDRLWAGVWAVLSAALLAAFDLWASLIILLAFLMFRIAVLLLPLLAVVGVYYPAGNILRRLANAVVTSTINVIFWGAGVAVYLWSARTVMAVETLPGFLRVVAVALVGVLIWWGLRRSRGAVVGRLPWTPEPVDHDARLRKLAVYMGAAQTAYTAGGKYAPNVPEGASDLVKVRATVDAITAATRSINATRRGRPEARETTA